MALRIINAAQVRELLPMSECIEAMDCAMRLAAAGQVAAAPRTIAPLMDDSGFLGLMPGSMLEPPVYGAKIVSLHPGNPDRGLPAIQGFVAVFDHSSGTPAAIIEGAEVTALRTAAASGLATRELARADADTHGIFGAGVLAGTHIDAIASVRPIERVVVWARDIEKGRRFAAGQGERTGMDVRATENPAQAGSCDVVSLVTGARSPVLKGEWLSPGAHVNAVGAHTPTSREADSDVVARSLIFVDSVESAMSEAGDLLIPIEEGRISAGDIVGEIGDVLSGKVAGRQDAQQITFYKSLGVIAQDLIAATQILEAAEAGDVGKLIDLA